MEKSKGKYADEVFTINEQQNIKTEKTFLRLITSYIS